MLPGLRASVADSRARAAATRARKAADVSPAEVDPVARVLVDVPLAHLDRPFDYLVPAKDAATAVPGARVKVRFAGQDVDGFVVARAAASDHEGRLAPLRRVVSAEPVLAPEVAVLATAVAERYAGSRADVLRLAVPPRHATTEAQPSPGRDAAVTPDPDAAAAAWAGHEPAAAFLGHLAAGGSPRAVWSAAPATDWPAALAHAAAHVHAGGRGALLVVPDHRDVARVDAALTAVLGEGHHVTLSADAGPAARYRDFLAVARGSRRVVLGTRAAAFAPVHDLGLVALWDDGDDLLAEPRAPYPHTREVLLLRAEQQGTGVLLGGHARSVEALTLVRTGWAREIVPPRAVLRERVRVGVVDPAERDHGARVPRAAYDAVRLRTGRRRARAGAGADTARRLRAQPGLRAVPHPCPLRAVPRPAAAGRPHRASALPLVRGTGTGLGLPGVRPPWAAGPGRGGGAHRRGARALVPRRPRPRLRRRPRPRRRAGRARDRRRHPGR